MKIIHLHGALGSQFEGPFSLDVRDPAEAVRALGTQLPGFRSEIESGNWHVLRGPLDAEDDLDEEGLVVALGQASEVHILPAVEGAGGWFNVIAGAALIAVAWWNPAGWAAGTAMMAGAAGAAMAVGGIVQLTTSLSGSDYDQRERPDQRPSFMFDGPVNTSTQGLPVPVIYGRVRVGSVVISAGMNSEEMNA